MYRQHIIRMIEKAAFRCFKGFGARLYRREVDSQLDCIWIAS